MHKMNIALASSVALLVFFMGLVFIDQGALAAPSAEYQAAYNEMTSRLPDDRYDLTRPGTSTLVSPSSGCEAFNPPTGRWGCDTSNYGYFNGGGVSHQYITLSKDSVNDDPSPSKAYAAKTVGIIIYTTTPGQKNLRVSVVDRAISPTLSCHNNLTIYYYKGDAGEGSSRFARQSVYSSIQPRLRTNGCAGSPNSPYTLNDADAVPAQAFVEMRDNKGRGTGIYRAKMVISFDANGNPVNGQTSFSISAVSDAKLGYLGSSAADREPPDTLQGRDDGWVNTYPTNYAKGHVLRFYFRPTCDIGSGDNFEFGWDDLNIGDRNGQNQEVQPNSPIIKIYRYRPDRISQDLGLSNPDGFPTVGLATNGQPGRVQTINNPGNNPPTRYQRINLNSGSFYGDEQSFAYMVQFENVYGGNGVTFNYPYDSSDARVPCPPQGGEDALAACSSTIGFTIPANGVKVRVYALNSSFSPGDDPFSPSKGSLVYDRNHHATAEVKLATDVGLDRLLSNNGFQVLVKPLNSSGDPTGSNLENGDGSPNRNIWTGTCFRASCNIKVQEVNVGWPEKAVKASRTFSISLSITNPEGAPTIPASIGGASIGIVDESGSMLNGSHSIGRSIVGGATLYVSPTVVLTAPDLLGFYDDIMKGYPQFGNRFNIGSQCVEDLSVYQQYDFTPAASTVLFESAENPEEARFQSSITQNPGSVEVDGTITRKFYLDRNDVLDELPPGPAATFNGTQLPNPSSGTYGNASFTDRYDFITPPELGDQYCMDIVLDRGHGWRGPASAGIYEYLDNRDARASDCDPPGFCDPAVDVCSPPPSVSNQPYVRVYGNDIAAGGGFLGSTNCSATESHILTFMSPVAMQVPGVAGDNQTGKSGSGGQLAAMALGDIEGFTSASMRTSAPTLPNGLTFANTDTAIDLVQPRIDSPLLGGSMTGGEGWCAPDYFKETQYPDADTDRKRIFENATSATLLSADISTRDKQQSVYRVAEGQKLNFTGNTAANLYNGHHTVYIDGDVYIQGNVMYKDSGWTNLAAIPSFAMIVKGNIYIDRATSQLDGLYVAQPRDDGTKGRIYTCAVGGAAVVDTSGLFNQCGASVTTTRDCQPAGASPRLTVNGAFVAQRVVLNRTGFTLFCSKYRDLETAASSRAAEVFNFSPEIYLSPPIFSPRATSTSGDYNYISSLPPIL